MSRRAISSLGCVLAIGGLLAVLPSGDGTAASRSAKQTERLTTGDRATRTHALTMIEDGQNIFRFDTFGDEDFWGDALKRHVVDHYEGPFGRGLSEQEKRDLIEYLRSP